MIESAAGPRRRADLGAVVEATVTGVWRDRRAVLVWSGAIAAFGLLSLLLVGDVSRMQATILRRDFDGPLLARVVVIAIAALAATLAVVVAAMRAALSADASADRLAWLRFGATELRVLAAMLLLGLGLYLALVVTVVLLFGIAAATGAWSAMLVAGVLSVVACGIALYLGVRMSLVVPLTVQRGKIAIREAWRLGRGRFWFLVLGYVLVALLSMVVMVPLFAVQTGNMSTILAAGNDPVAMRAAADALAAQPGPGLAASLAIVLLTGLANGIAMALQGGMAARLLLAIQAEHGAAVPSIRE